MIPMDVDLDRVLQVHVHRDHRISGGIFEPGEQRGFFAEVTREVDQHHAAIGQGDSPGMLGGAVGTAVVDKHDLKRLLVQRGLLPHAAVKHAQRLLLVIHRHHQRDPHCPRSRNTTHRDSKNPHTRLISENTATVRIPGTCQRSASHPTPRLTPPMQAMNSA